MVDCSPPLDYQPTHWITRAPKQLPRNFNLLNTLNTFDPLNWFLILFTLVCVTLFLIVVAKKGTHYGVGTDDWWNVAFVPFR